MFRRVVFNVVVRNQEDHTKNISFLMDKIGQSLAIRTTVVRKGSLREGGSSR
ncbi:MAG: HipA domain-containing protein [Candidatus Cryptobacteroides sp.]|nr:HipA domain-containing protein [Rikenellaceae bacterium]MDY5747490.1 HipA domain-containing protein [Candidatus Cryptobacteroides sp.]